MVILALPMVTIGWDPVVSDGLYWILIPEALAVSTFGTNTSRDDTLNPQLPGALIPPPPPLNSPKTSTARSNVPKTPLMVILVPPVLVTFAGAGAFGPVCGVPKV